MVKLNRMVTFQIKVRGEPAPTFSWLKEGQKLSSSENFQIFSTEHPDPAEQSTIATFQIMRYSIIRGIQFKEAQLYNSRTQMSDAGKYSLLAENKNGSDHVDLDLIVIDEVPVCDCDMFLNGNLDCGCNIRYRS